MFLKLVGNAVLYCRVLFAPTNDALKKEISCLANYYNGEHRMLDTVCCYFY